MNLTSMLKSQRFTPASANFFHFNPFSRLFSQIGEILRFCDFFVILYFFLRHASRWIDFHGLWLIRRAFAQGRSFWELRQYWNSLRGNVLPKNSHKGSVNRQFQAKRSEYKIRDILQSINTMNVQF